MFKGTKAEVKANYQLQIIKHGQCVFVTDLGKAAWRVDGYTINGTYRNTDHAFCDASGNDLDFGSW